MEKKKKQPTKKEVVVNKKLIKKNLMVQKHLFLNLQALEVLTAPV